MGAAENPGARVEEVTRQTGDDILLTEATRCLLCDTVCEFEERPTAELKGKTEQVRLWAPLTTQGAMDGKGPVREARSDRLRDVQPSGGA
jgi:class 3 adenylate cyclase